MPHYVPLSRSDHRHSSFVPQGYGFAARQPAVPVVMDELAQLLPSMPLALVKSEDRSRFQLVALQALEANNNVYVHTNGRWITGYRPAWYRAHPFRLLQQAGDETAERQRVLCVDTTAPGIEDHADDDAAIAFFDAAGEISPQLRRIMAFIEQLERALDTTTALVAQLEELGLVVPWHINIGEQNAMTPLNGLFHIDEQALRELSGDALSELARSGALSLAYSQLMSEHRLPVIEKLYALRREAQPADDVDPESLFGDDDDDVMFNFDD